MACKNLKRSLFFSVKLVAFLVLFPTIGFAQSLDSIIEGVAKAESIAQVAVALDEMKNIETLPQERLVVYQSISPDLLDVSQRIELATEKITIPADVMYATEMIYLLNLDTRLKHARGSKFSKFRAQRILKERFVAVLDEWAAIVDSAVQQQSLERGRSTQISQSPQERLENLAAGLTLGIDDEQRRVFEARGKQLIAESNKSIKKLTRQKKRDQSRAVRKFDRTERAKAYWSTMVFGSAFAVEVPFTLYHMVLENSAAHPMAFVTMATAGVMAFSADKLKYFPSNITSGLESEYWNTRLATEKRIDQVDKLFSEQDLSVNEKRSFMCRISLGLLK